MLSAVQFVDREEVEKSLREEKRNRKKDKKKAKKVSEHISRSKCSVVDSDGFA